METLLKWASNPEWWLAVFALATLIVVIVQTRATAKAAKAASDAALAAKLSVDAANKHIVAMEAQTRALVDSERAWVLGDQIGELPEVNYEPNRVAVLWVNVPVKNFGRTVATINETSQQAILIPRGKLLPDEPEYKSIFQSSNTLPPSVAQVLQVGIAANDFMTAKNGTNTLYIYGFARYSILGELKRESRFCYIYHVPSGFNPTPEGFYPCANCPKSYTECT